jgi:ribosomal protein L7/L12
MDTQAQALIRISALERKVSILFQHLGVAEPQFGEEVSPEVLDALGAGDTVRAIKLYREQSGKSLGEAKEYLERFRAQD